ncbi:DUF488 family protein [Allopusillimonas ginsengisoli]|uniref:DUF488 domain-containing protein n=1 Tax=Allopusillimonas ginsengisoli TaxID=453575 RepID=UPI0010210F29|nr:DUF488 domain-containing protein [Allopusillimonas ginsengisoli]TEA77215.1 DUF488 domain-containing protein [Allopusillimonas ginsengisoli]
MPLPFFTIGHSNRSLDAFADLLKEAGIEVLVDIRTVPRSRANPQFNQDTLPQSLLLFDIAYERIAELGGLRGKSKSVPRDVNGFWENDSFHNYADYALSDQFRLGLDQLIALGHTRRSAIMCSEAVWWRCHRRIVTDYLLARHEEVRHIMGNGRLELAKLTTGAVIQPDGTVRYPGA